MEIMTNPINKQKFNQNILFEYCFSVAKSGDYPKQNATEMPRNLRSYITLKMLISPFSLPQLPEKTVQFQRHGLF